MQRFIVEMRITNRGRKDQASKGKGYESIKQEGWIAPASMMGDEAKKEKTSSQKSVA